jgi:nucleotide-binding universal stress UspA family protein
MLIRSILVPLDFSPCSQRVVEWAVTLASASKAQITLLHVTSPDARRTTVEVVSAVLNEVTATPGWHVAPTPTSSVELRNASEALDRVRESEVPTSVESRAIVRDGTPWQCIVDEARAGNHDLIVMGTHGRSGIRRVLMGSTAEHVLRQAPGPVLIVP